MWGSCTISDQLSITVTRLRLKWPPRTLLIHFLLEGEQWWKPLLLLFIPDWLCHCSLGFLFLTCNWWLLREASWTGMSTRCSNFRLSRGSKYYMEYSFPSKVSIAIMLCFYSSRSTLFQFQTLKGCFTYCSLSQLLSAVHPYRSQLQTAIQLHGSHLNVLFSGCIAESEFLYTTVFLQHAVCWQMFINISNWLKVKCCSVSRHMSLQWL